MYFKNYYKIQNWSYTSISQLSLFLIAFLTFLAFFLMFFLILVAMLVYFLLFYFFLLLFFSLEAESVSVLEVVEAGCEADEEEDWVAVPLETWAATVFEIPLEDLADLAAVATVAVAAATGILVESATGFAALAAFESESALATAALATALALFRST